MMSNKVLEIRIGLVKDRNNNLFYEIELVFADGSLINKKIATAKLIVLDLTEGMAEA